MSNEELQGSMGDFLKDYDVKKLNRGEILKGRVIEVNDKEVSVNINYAFDGLISKEELSADGRDPREVVKKDDEIDVYVLSPNDGEGYVELSLVRVLAIKEGAFAQSKISKITLNSYIKTIKNFKEKPPSFWPKKGVEKRVCLLLVQKVIYLKFYFSTHRTFYIIED